MKCSEALRILLSHGWIEISQKGSHFKLRHPTNKSQIIFPNHGSQELGKGLESKIFKLAGIRK